MTNSTASSTIAETHRLCFGCDYSLNGLTSDRCPECGRPFDRNVPSTFNTRGPMMWWERLILRQPARAAWWITGIAIAAALWAGRTPTPASTLDWMLWWVFTCIYVFRLAAMGVLDRLTK